MADLVCFLATTTDYGARRCGPWGRSCRVGNVVVLPAAAGKPLPDARGSAGHDQGLREPPERGRSTKLGECRRRVRPRGRLSHQPSRWPAPRSWFMPDGRGSDA